MSDRGHSPVATAFSKQKAETKSEQKHNSEWPVSSENSSTAKYVRQLPEILPTDHKPSSDTRGIGVATGNDQQHSEQPIPDEAALIEERRKRREAIIAKHRGQVTPLLVQALALNLDKAPNLSKPPADVSQHPVTIQPDHVDPEANAQLDVWTTDTRSGPSTPKEAIGEDSPTELVVLSDQDLANQTAEPHGVELGDEPSAADYDPTMDMQEDRAKYEYFQLDEVPSGAYDETTAAYPDVLLPETSVLSNPGEKVKEEFDIFADEDDMFAEAPVAPMTQKETAKAVPIRQPTTVDMSMLDDWDDDEGYYKVIPGELLDNRYHVQSNLGRGMFSGVVRATDQKLGKLAAIKIIRNNESMLAPFALVSYTHQWVRANGVAGKKLA